ncbi:MAG: hypothetical protein H7321_00990 [Bacteroidia bacterium]|nr:hypothetical protein [Bacteroidia bacterium]
MNLRAQTIPASRLSDWSRAGLTDSFAAVKSISILNFSADISGVISCNKSLDSALLFLGAGEGEVYFPAGNYYFDKSVILPTGKRLKGEGAGSTILKFDLKGQQNCITISGSKSTENSALTLPAKRFQKQITVADVSGFNAGDHILITHNDSSLIFSDWALGTVAQVVKISAVSGNVISLEDALRKDFLLNLKPAIRKLNMISHCSIECLKIKRLDSSAGQTSTIALSYADNCRIKGIETENCNFAHIELNASTHCTISQSYFHHAFAYGGNGQGYGIAMQVSSGDNLITDNIFNHLRHGMLFQSGANGNVSSYNFSTEPNWTSTPSNSAGDIVLHGNYPHSNLFEGNIVQNIIIDNSHGLNGPHNVFFRNRAELFGIIMTTANADSTVFIGNEVNNKSFPYGMFTLQGKGNFSYANNVKGSVTPAGNSSITDSSLYLLSRPNSWSIKSPWPSVGYPDISLKGLNPASARWSDSVSRSYCYNPHPYYNTAISSLFFDASLIIYPNPSSDILYISNSGFENRKGSLINSVGQIVWEGNINAGFNKINLFSFPEGLYFFVSERVSKPIIICR